MNKLKYIFLTGLSLCALVGNAQKNPKTDAADSKAATSLFSLYGYKASLNANKKVLDKERDKEGSPLSTSASKAIQIAESYRLNGEYGAAAQWYGTVVQKSDKPIYKLYYAQCLQAVGNKTEAKKYYLQYDNAMQNNEETKGDTRGRDFAAALDAGVRHLADLKLTNADFNTKYLDFSAVPFGDGFVFASSRPNPAKIFRKKKDIWTDQDFYDLWAVSKDEDGEFGKPKVFSPNVNAKLHDATACFNAGQDVVYFTRNLIEKGKRKKDKKGVTRIGIYTAQLEGDSWTNVEPFRFNNEGRIYCHPTLTPDGSTLYFASDRPGGMGGLDIWFSKNEGGRWSKPVNMGGSVNSAGNEIFPYIHENGTLYFSSNGRGGVGGLDVFYSESQMMGDSTIWAAAQNMGTPINSKMDDFGFFANSDLTKGGFTSSREGGKGADDVYFFEGNAMKPAPKEIILDGNVYVYDAKTNKRLEKAELTASKEAPGAGGINPMMIILKPVDGQPNTYYMSTNGNAGNANGGGSNEPDSYLTDADGNVVYKMKPNEKYFFNVKKAGYKPAKVEFTPTGYSSSQKIEYGIPLEKIECLSLNGAVINTSFQNKPIPGAKVTLFDLCSGDVKEYTSDDSGNFNFCLRCGCDYELKGEKDRFTGDQKTIKLSAGNCPDFGVKEDLNLSLIGFSTKNDAPLELKEGVIVELTNVFYDFDKFNIRDDAALELDKLVMLLNQYPEMEIELGSHTDSRGSAEYNQKLSQNRAQAAVNYLITKGISATRLTARGYGEYALRNKCSDGVECTEEEHQFNRRTEFRIIKFPIKAVNVKYIDNRPVKIDKKPGRK